MEHFIEWPKRILQNNEKNLLQFISLKPLIILNVCVCGKFQVILQISVTNFGYRRWSGLYMNAYYSPESVHANLGDFVLYIEIVMKITYIH